MKDKTTIVRHSADPDAGYYVRPEDRDIGPKSRRKPKVHWAREASLAIMGSDDPLNDRAFPYLIVAMAPLHVPGSEPGMNGVEALRWLSDRKRPKGLVATDNAYVNSLPEKYQLPMRALGYQMLTDYRIDQLGRQGQYAGAVLVEGAFYCPAINETLIDATADYRNGRISDEIWKDRLAARQAYELKHKESPDAEGHVRLQCQAAGSCPTVKCQLKPKSEKGNSAKPRIHVPVEITDHPPSICRQQSVVFPPDAGAKYLQPLTYQSDEWRRKYKMLRSTIEGANGYAKDAGFENMHDARRRRMRGTAMQTVLVALQLFGSNLRKIDGFIRDMRLSFERNERTAGRRPRRRRTIAIQTYLPTPVGVSP